MKKVDENERLIPLQVHLKREDRKYFIDTCIANNVSASEVLRNVILKLNKAAKKKEIK